MFSTPRLARAAFRSGAADKYQHAESMHAFHSILFDYAELIRVTQTESIEITDGQVVVKTREGVRFLLDSNDRSVPSVQLLNFGDYEAGERELMNRILKPNMTVFDVGANVGWYSFLYAQKVPHGHVFAFEPLPRTFQSLQANYLLNGSGNLTLLNCGLGEKDEQRIFYFSPEVSGAASAANILSDRPSTQVVCRLRRLDEVWKELKVRVDLIKCDVEGGELFVFRGGLECIASDHPVIFSEMLRKWSAKFNYHPNDIIELLESIGYECFAISGGALRRLVRMTDTTEETNFAFLHGTHHSKLAVQLAAEGRLTR